MNIAITHIQCYVAAGSLAAVRGVAYNGSRASSQCIFCDIVHTRTCNRESISCNLPSNIFQNQIQPQPQQPSSILFQPPQPQKQPSFTAPTNQPTMLGQGGLNFQANPSGLNINYSAGTPGDLFSGRPMARARRRKK